MDDCFYKAKFHFSIQIVTHQKNATNGINKGLQRMFKKI